jgi:hypothetical protein
MTGSDRRAAVIVANDSFIDYVIPFLESFRTANPEMRLIVIPFDHNVDKISRLSVVYGCDMYEGSFDKIDSLSAFIFGSKPYLRNRMRKLIAFDLDVDEFIYIDADIIVQQSLQPFFGKLCPGEIDLVYLERAGKWVYSQDADRLLDLRHSGRFASGFFVSSKRVASLDEICQVMQDHRDLFLAVRIKELFDQPLINFFFDITGRKPRNARELEIPFVYCDVFVDPAARISDDGRFLRRGNQIVTLTHWAGAEKFEQLLPFAQLLKLYATQAAGRLQCVPELSGWVPFYAQAKST